MEKKKDKENKEENIIYKITIPKEFSLTKKEEVFEFDNLKDLNEFLGTKGYRPEESGIVDLVENGGEYKGLKEVEFKIEVIKPEEKKTPFNNAELFVKEYRDYLIGKKIKVSGINIETNTYNITDVYDTSKDKLNIVIKGKDIKDFKIEIPKDEYQNFIDGAEIADEGVDFTLILQEEKEENKFNKPEFKYYIVDKDNSKVIDGFEYKEDATFRLAELEKFGNSGLDIISKKDAQISKRFNVEDDSNWNKVEQQHDWEIIKKALDTRVSEKEISPKEADQYLNSFKQTGNNIWAIKSALILFLNKEQRKLRDSYMMSNLERINEGCDDSCRIQKELKRVIAMEK